MAGITSGGIELNAESVMGLFAFLDPTRNKHRVFTSEDLVKESEKIRGQARVQTAQMRETDAFVDERRSVDDRVLGGNRGTAVVSSTAGSDPSMLRAHNFAPVFLR